MVHTSASRYYIIPFSTTAGFLVQLYIGELKNLVIKIRPFVEVATAQKCDLVEAVIICSQSPITFSLPVSCENFHQGFTQGRLSYNIAHELLDEHQSTGHSADTVAQATCHK